MDVTGMGIGSALEKGAELHLKHPIAGHLMYSGEGAHPKTGALIDKKKPHEPISLFLRHPEAPSVREQMRQIEALKAAGEDISTESVGIKFFTAMLIDWRGIGVNGQDASPCNAENVKAFFDSEFGDMVGSRQVIPFVSNGKNFVRNLPKG